MLNRSLLLVAAGATGLLLAGCNKPESNAHGAADKAAPAAGSMRDQVRIVGSSTVYPFSSFVAEAMGASGQFKSPVVESTGSGGGFKLFCGGDGSNTPDITNASRRMKGDEFDTCQSNGVTSITEVKIGFDGIVIASHKGAAPLKLTREQLLLAVAAEVPKNGALVANPYKRWNEIDPSLPNHEILVYGPPTSSGTRDAFEEMVMEKLTKKMAAYGNEAYKKIRDDGLYVASGENDNLIVQKLEKNDAAIGIFGYSFLEENTDKVQAATIDGVYPEPDSISSGKYPVSRSLFFYVKNSHLDKVAGLSYYVKLFTSEKMIGNNGELSSIGLIPLPETERSSVRAAAAEHKQLAKADLK